MKIQTILVTLAICAVTALGQDNPSTKDKKDSKGTKTTSAAAKKSSVKPAARVAADVTVPAGATKTSDTTYAYTDTQGKKWIYQVTPFGVKKTEEGSQAVVTAAPRPSGIKAIEDGDNVRFESPSPFGTQKWTRKKSELSDDERAIWEKQKPKE